MKIICVADAFVTPGMMEEGVRPRLRSGDVMQVFFFGYRERAAMRDLVKTIESRRIDDLELPEGLLEAIKDADLLITHLCPANKRLIAAAGSLKAIMSCRGGLENIDIPAATEKGIIVSNNPAHNANGVAEFTIGLILSETRNIARADAALKRGEWRKVYPNTATTIKELCDCTVGIIGFGTIGRLVAERLSVFGCGILVYDPYTEQKDGPYYCFTSKEDLLRRSDIVTLHARANGVIMGEEEFAMMKPNSYLINSARSYLVDPAAFRKAMDSGKLLGAAFDVFESEPDIPEFYRRYDNVTLTNHRAGDTIESYSKAPEFAINNYLGYLEGRPLRFKVN